jgi:molecular chaperone DnaK
MTRSTIDFGIDLGTTNSALAVLKGVTTEVIKNNRNNDITPSAVYIGKKGNLEVGISALNRALENPDDAYTEFKRRMGTDHVYRFKSSGQSLKPEDLSAEVIKSLRNDVQVRTGELLEAAVITVPAAFELHQCDATRRAAMLAGLKDCPLLQEPVAAALAYGFQSSDQKAYWLIYDFGGGTFDAALIKSEDGTINVVNHGGDNFLGGSDIDWAIVEEVLVPRLLNEFHLKDFTRGNMAWRFAFSKLKYAAETSKIDLSQRDAVTLEASFPNVNGGEPIQFECDLTRSDVAGVAEPYIQRSVDICKKVLREKSLGRDAVARVILVGGPTLAPYFRDTLSAQLGLKLDFSVDPLTVVARGAAVFAGTRKVTSTSIVATPSGTFLIDLKYKPVGLDSSPLVGGRVSNSVVTDFTGFSIELVNSKSQWRSGKVPLKKDGVFLLNLHADRGDRNEFRIELYDSTARRHDTDPSAFNYTIGAVVEEQPLINSMGVALANNQYLKFFEKGSGLPLKKMLEFKTIQALRKGQSGDILKVPVIEGENELADRNRLIGTLDIKCDQIRRDLPAGSDVEVTLKIDESRIVSVHAFVPILDEEYEAVIDMRRHTASVELLKKDYELEMQRFREVKAKSAVAEASSAGEVVVSVESSPLLRELRDTLESAKADPDAAAKCEKRLLEFKLKLDEATNYLEWPAMVAEARDWLDHLGRVSADHGNAGQKAKSAELAEEIEQLIAQRRSDRLRSRIDLASRLYFEICMAQSSWWVYQFQLLEKQRGSMTDQSRASRLLDQGRDCISKDNVTGLQNVVKQLWDLTPDELAATSRRGYGSGLTR